MADTRDKELMEKEAALKAEIERMLPDFAKAVRDQNDVVLIHQDSFLYGAGAALTLDEFGLILRMSIGRVQAAPVLML